VCYISHPSHRHNNIWRSSSICSALQPPTTSSLLRSAVDTVRGGRNDQGKRHLGNLEVDGRIIRVGWPRFDSRQSQGIFLFAAASRQTLGPILPPNQCAQGLISLGVKLTENEVDYSLPYIVKVKNGWSFTSIPPFMALSLCQGADLL